MPRAIAIVIGVGGGSAIDDFGFPTLEHCEPAARTIACHARALGYDPVIGLIGPGATFEAVDRALFDAGTADPPWDTVLLVFSGHGFQKPDGLHCDNQTDHHWCLFDKPMVDHHLLTRTQKFPESTRLFIVADCCYATRGSGYTGRVARAMAWYADKLLPGERWGPSAFWEDEVFVARRAARRNPDFDCSSPVAQVLLLAASSTGKAEAGLFMNGLLTAWDEPGARTTFRTLRDRIRHLGGRPVLEPTDSPLLDAPAFEP